jgi:hypothetical protein
MNKLIVLISIVFLTGCTFSKDNKGKNLDIFERIFLVRKTRDLKDLEVYFGKPTEIKPSHGDASSDDYYFSKTDEHPSMDVFVDRSSKKIKSFSLTFWGNFDAYPYLKNRFKDYKWIETELLIRTDLDYAEEIHRVEIPELGITFEFDNQDPLRRPQSIFFK